MYLINEVSKISGITVRTLQHYDNIGLLSAEKNEKGYRYYTDDDMSKLQSIMFYKYLGFSLQEIKELLQKSDVDLLEHYKKQLILLQNEKEKLLTLIDTLEKTIDSSERKISMKTEEKFKGFTYDYNSKYQDEAIKKYGKEVIEEAIEKQKGKEQEITDGFNKIFFAFADNMNNNIATDDEVNIQLAKNLHNHLCEYSFDCSLEVFSQIGFGYVYNEEFKTNMDKFGAGTAQYVCDSIQSYVAKCSK